MTAASANARRALFGRPRARALRAAGVVSALLGCAAVSAQAAVPTARESGRAADLVERAEGVLSGVTVDVLGRALAGVQVLVSPLVPGDPAVPVRRVSSDDRGRFRIEGLEPGRYRLVAAKSGYGLVVGRVDTLVRSTVDLVLRPSGAPAEPGTRPRDASWVLRLPDRDVLEDLGSGPAPDAPPAGRAARAATRRPAAPGIPLTLRLDGARESGAGAPQGAGWGLGAAGAWASTRLGLLSLDVSHARLGERDGPRRDEDRLSVSWKPAPGDAGGGFAAVSVTAARRERGLGDRESLAEVEEREAGLAARFGRVAAGTSLDGSVALQYVDFLQDGGLRGRESASHLSVRARAGLESTPRVGVTHTASVEVIAARARSGDPHAPAGGVVGPVDARDLDSLSGERARLSYRQTRRLGPLVTLFGGATIDHDSDAPGSPDAGILESGLLWQFAPRWAVSVRGGVADPGRGGGRAVFAVGAEHSGERLSLRAVRDRGVGGSDPGLGELDPGRQATVLLAARDAVIDRWLAEARWNAARPGLPSLALRASWSSLEGDAAARLPDDLARLPVVRGARAERFLVAMDVRFAGSGTLVGLSLEEFDQRDGAQGFVAGARGWTRRALTVRQRIGDRDIPGSGLYLLFGIAQTDPVLEAADPPVAGTASPRLALLDRRRVSGGLALAF